MVNKDNTLTVEYLLKAVADGRVRTDMPLGVLVGGKQVILGVDAFELHTYEDGSQVFMIHCPEDRPVSTSPGSQSSEVGF